MFISSLEAIAGCMAWDVDRPEPQRFPS